MESIILASASPRRQELLSQIGITFSVLAQDIDESIRSAEEAQHYVLRMAREKAESALGQLEVGDERLVLTADTTVVCDSDILGKPTGESDALDMLERLSAREHRVLSAVTVASKQEQKSALSESLVTFRPITSEEALSYWRSGEPMGKAGAYGIQGYAAVFVERLVGSYSGVMGLPLFETAQLLGEFSLLPPSRK